MIQPKIQDADLKLQKKFLVIGYGVTGQLIANELRQYGQVIITDIKDVQNLHSSTSDFTYIKYSRGESFLTDLVSFLNTSFEAIVHTYLGNKQDVETIINQLQPGVTKHFTTLGTLMTYDQNSWQKIDAETGSFWNKYQYDKLIAEQMLLLYCNKNDISLYIPETFHILGSGFGVGIVGPHFRMNQASLKEYTALPKIILSGNSPKVWIDNQDFARMIASGIYHGVAGYQSIFSPNAVTPIEYYTVLDRVLGLEREIEIAIDISANPKCMNQSWVPTFSTIQNYNYTSLQSSLESAVKYLKDDQNPTTRNIYKIMSESLILKL